MVKYIVTTELWPVKWMKALDIKIPVDQIEQSKKKWVSDQSMGINCSALSVHWTVDLF